MNCQVTYEIILDHSPQQFINLRKKTLDKPEHLCYYIPAQLTPARADKPMAFDLIDFIRFSKSNKIAPRPKNALFASKTPLFHRRRLKNVRKLAKSTLAAP
jgi:hypothetical protein